MGQPWLVFVYFLSFQTQIVQKKTVGVSGIRTRIVGVTGERADHLTTTTALTNNFLMSKVVMNEFQSEYW